MNAYHFSPSILKQYRTDGFVLIPNLLDERETELLISVAKADHAIIAGEMSVEDVQGRKSRLNLRKETAHDIYSAIVHSPRIIDPMEQMLEGPVYHWHHKMMLKEPRVGGAWEWHQDYGYWYLDNCLLPDMASCMIAVDRATRENGCLQVLRGSHRIGRIEHGTFGTQAGADPARVAAAMNRFERVYCEMQPGTGLFFHGNLLHSSSANLSNASRWSLICCYNAMGNAPFAGPGHGKPVAIDRWPDDQIAALGQEQMQAMCPPDAVTVK